MGGGAVLTLVVVATLFWAQDRPDHTTAGDTPEPHEFPTTVSEHSWTWNAPEDTDIIDTHTLPFGLAAQLDDGVVALDGATGEEHWRYLRSDRTVSSAHVTPDGQHIALAFDEEESEEGAPALRELVVLESGSGEITAEHEIPRETAESDALPYDDSVAPAPVGADHLTDDARLVLDTDDGLTLRARALQDDAVRWSHEEELPEEVEQSYAGQVLSTGETVFLSHYHRLGSGKIEAREYTAGLVALEADSGDVRWERTWDYTVDESLGYGTEVAPYLPILSTSPHSSDLVAVRLGIDGPGWALDVDTGEERISDFWDDGHVVGLFEDSYTTTRGVPVYRDHDGRETDEVKELPLREGQWELAQVAATPEAFIGLYADYQQVAIDPERSEEAVIKVIERESGQEMASIDLDLAFSRQGEESTSELEHRVVERSRFLHTVPGALVVLDEYPTRNGGTGNSRSITGLT